MRTESIREDKIPAYKRYISRSFHIPLLFSTFTEKKYNRVNIRFHVLIVNNKLMYRIRHMYKNIIFKKE